MCRSQMWMAFSSEWWSQALSTSYVCRDIIVSKLVFIGNHASLGNGLSVSEQICLILELKPYSKATSLYWNNTTPMKQLHLPSGCHYMHEDAPYYVVITHHNRTSTCTIGLPLNLLIEIKPGFWSCFLWRLDGTGDYEKVVLIGCFYLEEVFLCSVPEYLRWFMIDLMSGSIFRKLNKISIRR